MTLVEAEGVTPGSPDLLAIDQALAELAKVDQRKETIVELRFFGGLTLEETAGYLGVSTATVVREWRRAKAWLYRRLTDEPVC